MIQPSIYVDCSIAAMKLAKTEADLIRWWNAEKPNREKWRLSPTQDPGRKLAEAFAVKRNELKGT